MSTTDLHTNVQDRATKVAGPAALEIERIRQDFPILHEQVNGQPLVYFDNAATSQKPRQVVDATTDYYFHLNSNVHRGVHTLSQAATDTYEVARRRVAKFIGAHSDREIVFTGGTTESINLVATSFAVGELKRGDEIIVTELEHHSNFVPWQRACQIAGAQLRIVESDLEGRIDLDHLAGLISNRTRLVAITHVSNTLGSLVDLNTVARLVHGHGVPVLVDGAQAVPHLPIDLSKLDVDFYAFSGHKVFGPMGIGVLYGKEEWLQRLMPANTGGGMIDRVLPSVTTWADLPHKHEAGTPNVAGAVGLAAAFDYIDSLGFDRIVAYEKELTMRMQAGLSSVEGVRILGPATDRAGVFSFMVGNAHPFDVGSLLDEMGIAVRTGHHCNQPLMKRLGIPGTVRASLAFYNTVDEIDRFLSALEKISTILR